MTLNRILLLIFSSIFCLIAFSAFALSYNNLLQAAIDAGIPDTLAPLWPICLDCFLVSGSLFILRASLYGESTISGWIILITFTAVSTLFNIVHSPQNLISQAAHAVPPVALCIDLEMLMYVLKSDIKRNPQILRSSVYSENPLTDEEKVKKCIDEHPKWNRNMIAVETGVEYNKVSQIFSGVKT